MTLRRQGRRERFGDSGEQHTIEDVQHLLPSYRTQVRLFLLPYLLGMLLLVVIPAAATLFLAFTDYNTIQPPRWVGLEGFQRLWASPLVRLSLRNSLLFLWLAVPLRLLGALALALLLRPGRRAFNLFRPAVYLPTIIPEAAYALLWLWIFNPLYGPLNALLGWAGLPMPNWLVEPGSARLAFVIMAFIQLGEGFVVALVALQTIPAAYYESARVDGANRWQTFWRITLPLIAPWLLLLTFRDLVVSLQNTFTPSFIMTYGGPYYATTFLPLMIYELAFDFFEYGLAAGLLVVTFILTGLLVVGILNVVGGGQHSDA